jgi:hypothetical protein
MNDAKRRALVAITREALGMPEQSCCDSSPSSATAEQPSACCPTEQSAGPAQEQTGCCAEPRETVLKETTKGDSGNISAKCCTP